MCKNKTEKDLTDLMGLKDGTILPEPTENIKAEPDSKIIQLNIKSNR